MTAGIIQRRSVFANERSQSIRRSNHTRLRVWMKVCRFSKQRQIGILNRGCGKLIVCMWLGRYARTTMHQMLKWNAYIHPWNRSTVTITETQTFQTPNARQPPSMWCRKINAANKNVTGSWTWTENLHRKLINYTLHTRTSKFHTAVNVNKSPS